MDRLPLVASMLVPEGTRVTLLRDYGAELGEITDTAQRFNPLKRALVPSYHQLIYANNIHPKEC